MTDHRFTPGPWKPEYCGTYAYHTVVTANPGYIDRFCRKYARKNARICNVPITKGEQSKANTVLLAAAPDMLTALYRAAHEFRSLSYRNDSSDSIRETAKKMAEETESVIANAIGVQCLHVYNGWKSTSYKGVYTETCIKCGFVNEFEKDFT